MRRITKYIDKAQTIKKSGITFKNKNIRATYNIRANIRAKDGS